jgi:hypothetical protein
VLTLAIEDDGGMPKNFTQVGLSTDIVGDDTFADYIDDKLEKIRATTTAAGVASQTKDEIHPPMMMTTTIAAGNPHKTTIGIDALELITQRLHKLMRQWDNVVDGNLVLTPMEARVRKAKISRRFDKLCEYVRELPIDETMTDELADELRLLLDVKWNRVNSEYFINIDTGEIRVPGGGERGGSGRQGQVEKFMESVWRFKETESGFMDEVDDNDISDDGESIVVSGGGAPIESADHVVIRVGSSSDEEVAVSFKGYDDGASETKSLVFDDSKKTNKLLKKQSTRPWTSYKQGSALLIICWFLALVNSCLLPFNIVIQMPQGVPRPSHGRWVNAGDLPGSDAGMAAAHIAARVINHGR